MKKTELQEAMMNLRSQINAISDKAKAEKRSFTAEETTQYDALVREYEAKEREMRSIVSEAQFQAAQSGNAQGFSLTKALREARATAGKTINLREALTAASLAGKAVETEVQSILAPLYADSALTKLGVKWYKDMPMGDISIPVMNKGSVSWKGESGSANASTDGTPTFGTNIVLKPKRLTGFFEISEQMLLQDTLGVEQALRAEAVKALADKFEATVLGNAAGTDDQPAGLFHGATLQDATTFAKVCDIEASVEDNCIGGELKYALSTKAKASLRSMAKSAKSTQLVMEGGSVDGTPAITTQNIKNGTKGIYAYGNFQNLACASWADLIFKVDDSINYQNGLIRIYVSGYFDAKVLRSGAFAFGDTRAVAAQ